jgi:hypothetical protein
LKKDGQHPIKKSMSMPTQQRTCASSINLFREKTKAFVWIVCFICLPKKGIEGLAAPPICGSISGNSKCSYAKNPHKTITLGIQHKTEL